MAASRNTILVKMLDRLYAGLASGPNLNCRPHSSRQRIDWTQFSRLQDLSPLDALRQLLSDKQSAQMQAKVSPPKKTEAPAETKKRAGSLKEKLAKPADTESLTPREDSAIEELKESKQSHEEQKQCDDWAAQQSLLTKLRGLAEDAREYEQDTGVHVLHVGFPLLSLPPTSSGSLKSTPGGAKRLLAPIAFVPVSLTLKSGPRPGIIVEGLHDGADFLVPNEALFALLERQTGKQILPDSSLTGGSSKPGLQDDPNQDSSSTDDSGGSLLDPWVEVNDLVRRVCEALHLPPCSFTRESLNELRAAPRGDDDNSKPEIVPAAVIGLFPMNNQGLLRDMQSMVLDTSLQGPIQSFLTIDAQLATTDERPRSDIPGDSRQRFTAESERLISLADPCQARAVRLARDCSALVVHGPPGTGKSQTITNMIGDHLARGERVLLVCDKRTALDVVALRLEHLGLGSLCALIHDPQHDQRNLYRQVREQLEALTSTKSNDRAAPRLKTLDRQQQRACDALTSAWELVMTRDPERGVSFHERMGEWLESAVPRLANLDGKTKSKGAGRRRREKVPATPVATEPVSMAEFQHHAADLRDLVARACDIGYADQPWRRCTGMTLASCLQRSKAQLRDEMEVIIDCASSVDETANKSIPSFLLPKENDLLASGSVVSKSSISFPAQGSTRSELADRLERCLKDVVPAWRKRWTEADKSTLSRARERLLELKPVVNQVRATPLDPQLLLLFRQKPRKLAEIAEQTFDLDAYHTTAGTWYAWFAIQERSAAAQVLRSFGLALNHSNASRLQLFLLSVTNRLLITGALQELTDDQPASEILPTDETLLADWDRLETLLDLLHLLNKQQAVASIADDVRRALNEQNETYAAGLRASVTHAESLEDLRAELTGSGLFHPDWIRSAIERVCRGESITDEVRQLASSLDALDDVLRIQATLEKLPSALRSLTERTISEITSRDSTNVDDVINVIHHQVLCDDVALWLKSKPDLQALDGKRLNDLTREIRQLQTEKQQAVRDSILDYWIGRQRDRLLVATGFRLNGLGADLRRRLTTRGERAMRLRQVIAVGARNDGGDPLFDLRPVWMASPETVAQILPREPLFDVVIFDEASQCRLEEALPVLTRAKRVVIAGDPKQLPPTRFFESAVVTSDNATVETDQDLFEAHQSEIEDLLTAALSLDIQESYLDVHYRSKNADLVEFSNEQFYNSRLQAIPGHPKNRIRFAPITLYPVNGVYEERTNPTEATQVCRIVADLLRRSEPPSIGIACFNLTQRDMILEKLNEMCSEDEDFAARLAAARIRVGKGAFEGLFVKNLENVQGDERDHMIISTTYGPDKQGRFYRRFGPLGQAGGGRRLNVLVTRAREEVHLVTSIPADQYRNLPPIPSGQQPGGAWLLFAYLAYAEQLSEDYRRWRDSDAAMGKANATVFERKTRTPSQFASEMAQLVATRHGLSSDVYWGNDGFCVDVAFHHPTRPEDRTLGLLCDGTRFQYADDPVEWDIFRTVVLESQGWQLTRCWTPEFFRDPEGFVEKFIAEANRIANTDPDPEAIRVE